MDLTGRVAWVTGAARRLGRALALDLAGRGADVVIHYHRSEAEARETAGAIEQLGRRALLVQADLASVPAIEAAVASIEREWGRLDVLVNNASNFLRTPSGKVTEDQWNQSLNTNLRAAFFCAQGAARLMRLPKPDGQSGPAGKIISLADSAALRPYPNHLPYLVSKAGLIAMTQALALELAPEIHVNAVAPGIVMPPEEESPETLERATRFVPLERAGSPEDIVAAVRFLLVGTDYVTGQVWAVDGGRLIAQPPRR